MSLARFVLPLALSAACSSPDYLGAGSVSFLGGTCSTGAVAVDVGWTIGMIDCNDSSEPDPPVGQQCINLGGAATVAMQPLTIVLTKAALEATGDVPLTTAPQTPDVASVAITLVDYEGGTALADGTFALSMVAGGLSATFNVGSGSDAVSGTIDGAPYCP
jgi:hypothetical protein